MPRHPPRKRVIIPLLRRRIEQSRILAIVLDTLVTADRSIHQCFDLFVVRVVLYILDERSGILETVHGDFSLILVMENGGYASVRIEFAGDGEGIQWAASVYIDIEFGALTDGLDVLEGFAGERVEGDVTNGAAVIVGAFAFERFGILRADAVVFARIRTATIVHFAHALDYFFFAIGFAVL